MRRTADLFEKEIATEPPDAGEEGERRPRGAYFTPDELALAICGRYAEEGLEPRRILEPGCGGGAFLRAAHATWPKAELLGIDLLPCCKGPGRVRKADFFDTSSFRRSSDLELEPGAFDLILGNPDFEEAERHILRALELLEKGQHLGFLLRIALAGGTREKLYGANGERKNDLLRLDPIGPRPSFTGGGSDKAQEYAAFLWRKGYRGDSRGRRLTWEKPRKRAR